MKKIILINLFSLFLLTGFGQVEKVVLIEEGTGTWCSWCPRGFHYGHELMVDHPGEVILIAVHSGDDMEMEDATYSSSLAIASYPSGHVDRSIMGSDPTEWNSDFDTQSALTPPANIAVTTSYNEETGALDITVSAEFFETVTGDYRLGAIVVEDGITGPAPAYDQSNSYSGGGAGPLGGWELLPNPVPASEMVYDHVARQLVSNFNGDPGSLPGTPTSGSTYDYEWSSTIPEFMNADYTYIVGVLIDASTGEVLNAGKSDYLTGNDNAIPFFYSSDMTSSVSGSPFNFDVKAHDPDDDFVTITATGLPAWLTATDDGEGITALEGYPTDPGTYTIELEVFDGEHTGYQTLTIEIIDAAEDWIQVGEPGFTAGSAYGSIIDFMEGTAVMMYSDDTDGLAWYEYSDESWSLIGTIPSADNFHWDFAVSPDQTAFYATDEGGIKIYEWDGTSWNQIGSTLSAGRNMDIAFDSDSNPFITYTDSESNLGFVYKYTGGSWNLVGDGSYSEAIAVWGQLTIDSEGNPAVAYGSGDGWTLYTHVSKFDGSDWILYGGGAIDPDNATYFNHQIKYDGDDNLTLLICSNAGPQQLDGYRWSGSEWTSIGENISGGGTENISMQVNNEDNIVVAFTDLLNGNGVSVYTYNGSEWTPIGLTGFTPIAGGVSLAIDTDGIPFVSYTDANEGDKVSAKKYSEVVGIKTLDDVDEDLVIYPNPTKDFVNIRVPENQNGALVQIFDLSGKTIYTTTAVTSTVQINVSGLSPGIYIVRVGNQQTRLVIR